MSENFEPNALFKPVNRTPWQDFWHHFKRNRPAVMGIVIVLILALVAISAMVGTTGAVSAVTGGAVKPSDPNATNVIAQFVPPFSYGEIKVPDETVPAGFRVEKKFYLLGTDDLGRDSMVRLWSGSTVSLLVGFVSVGISVLIGILVGGIAGFYGRGKVTLPFLLCIVGPPLSMLVGSITAIGPAREGIAMAILGLSVAALVLLVVGAFISQSWRTLAIFGVMVGVAFMFFAWPRIEERAGPPGQALHAHRAALEKIVDVRQSMAAILPATSDYERMKSLLNAKEPLVTKSQVDALADLVGRGQAVVEVKLAELASIQAEANLLTARATILDADLKIASESGREVVGADDEKQRAGAIAAAEAAKKSAQDSLKDLEKGFENSKSSLEKAKQVTVLSPDKLTAYRDLQLKKAEQNKLRAPHQAAEKTSIDQLIASSTMYSLTRKLSLLIIVGFFLALSFILLAKAGQDGARRVKVLNALFVPIITVDNFAMRSVEVLMTMPTLVLLLTIMAFYDRDVWLVMFVIGILSWMGTARFVRAEILSLRERDFIAAAKSLGLSDAAIIIRHLVPNALSPVLVSATIGVASAIILESTLSFLGLGASAEQVTWGKMLADSRQYITHAPWLFIMPGLAILIVVLAFNLLGEGMREAMNPKLRKR